MNVQVKTSKNTKVCIVYHPNPTAISEQLEKVKEILKEV